MKITLFTSNQIRHNYLSHSLLDIATELNVVQENSIVSSKITPGHYPASSLMKEYFLKVNYAQKKIFGNPNNLKTGKNISVILPCNF